MSEPKSRDTARQNSSFAHTVARSGARDGLPPLPKAGPMRGAPARMQPVVRQEGGATRPVRREPTPVNVINFAKRAQTAKPHPSRQAHALHVAAQAIDFQPEMTIPDRTEPMERVEVAMPLPAPPPPPPVVARPPAPIPQHVIAEGSVGVPQPPEIHYAPPPPQQQAPFYVPPPRRPRLDWGALKAKVLQVQQKLRRPKRAPDPQQWASYEQLGLGEKKVKKQSAQQWMVSTYRVLGFGILTIIVVVLIGYILTTAFYWWNTTWIQPMVVSPTDEKVLALQAQVATQMNERDRIQAELTAADQELAVEQDFQAQFAAAIKSDLDGRKTELGRVKSLAYQYAGARAKIERSNSAYAAQSAKQMKQEYAAGLIDRSEMLSGKFQLAQITQSTLGLADREAEFENRAGELDQQAKALEALLADKTGQGGGLSYDVLKIKQEYENSRLATARAMATRDALRAALTRENAIVKDIEAQPYLRALADKASVAFVPYGNMGHVEKGTKLYACGMEMIWCHSVGKVLEVLPGEVQFKHPHGEKMLRGQLVELDLDADELETAQKDVLFVGGRPLWL